MRNRLVQFALGFGLLALLVEVTLIAPRQIREAEQRPKTTAPTTPTTPRSDVDQSMNGMHMIETQEGRKEWEIWSKQALSLKPQEVLELKKVKAVFFSEKGVTFTVTGDEGRVQLKTKNLRVDGNVVTRSSNGYVFKTASMDYDSAAKVLKAPNKVTMLGPKDQDGHALKLTGSSMEASVLKATMDVRHEVRAEKALDKNRAALIRSQRSLFSGRDRTARFVGDVVLDLDSMRITGPEAEFEYDDKGQGVKSVYFAAGARVSDSDKWATADKVKVDFDQNRFIFRGHPRVVQNNDELRGEEIVFLDGGKRVRVQGARARVDEKRTLKATEKSN